MKSEQDKLLDDLLREKLGSYHEQPPTGVWQGIAQKLPYRPFGKYFPGSDSGILVTLIGGIIVVTGLVYFLAGNFDTRASKEKPAAAAMAESPRVKATSPVEDSEPVAYPASKKPASSTPGSQGNVTYTAKMGNTPSHAVAEPQKTSKKASATYASVVAKAEAQPKTQAKTVATRETPVQDKAIAGNPLFPGSSQRMAAMTSLKSKPSPMLADKNNTYYIQSLRNEHPGDNFRLNPRRKGPYYQARGMYCLSAFYRPEFLKNRSEPAYADERYAGGLSFRYTRNLLLLETGLEVNRETRSQDYNVQYFDYLGTYNNLDSIAFAQQGGQTVPSYYYTTDSVYDPELTTDVFSNKASYSFLKIPLLIGMEKTLGAFTIGVKGGLMFGVLLNSSGTAFTNQDPESKIYNYNSASPNYLGTNIQWVLKADIDWQIRPNFGLTVGPMINEYLTDPYEGARGTVDSPVYWGIQGGVFYKW